VLNGESGGGGALGGTLPYPGLREAGAGAACWGGRATDGTARVEAGAGAGTGACGAPCGEGGEGGETRGPAGGAGGAGGAGRAPGGSGGGTGGGTRFIPCERIA
jgi:hypothetical protein